MNELSSFSSATVKTIRATTATTGAGSKRAAGEAIDADRPTWELKKPSKKIATAADSKEPATEDQHFFRFLDLSPELRNRVAQIHEYEDVSDYDNCECPDHDWTRREWSAFKFEQMKYTHSIRNFIRNLNKSWLKAVREDKMTVTYGINEERCHGTFRILCREPICQTTTESQPALDLLEQWGIFDLIVKKCTVFVMAYEDEQITERNGRKITNSVVREVRVYKVATKHQAASSI
ncbi:unnamed protein product [Alternaria alternata]